MLAPLSDKDDNDEDGNDANYYYYYYLLLLPRLVLLRPVPLPVPRPVALLLLRLPRPAIISSGSPIIASAMARVPRHLPRRRQLERGPLLGVGPGRAAAAAADTVSGPCCLAVVPQSPLPCCLAVVPQSPLPLPSFGALRAEQQQQQTAAPAPPPPPVVSARSGSVFR